MMILIDAVDAVGSVAATIIGKRYENSHFLAHTCVVCILL